jgi:hypothetical protein
MQSGYKSTEFYTTLISTVVGLAVLAGFIKPEESSLFTNALVTIIGGLLTLIPPLVYIINRTWLKSKTINQSSTTTTVSQLPPTLTTSTNVVTTPEAVV